MDKLYIKKQILNKINQILNEINVKVLDEKDYYIIIEECYKDVEAFSSKDPSSGHDTLYILKFYSSYYAVICYRIANYIYYHIKDKYIGKMVSEHAKTITGIEIHPAAKIGSGFVIDHGVGTVIGETVIIGDNCYLLQNIVLGSSQIANNKDGLRHPIIGDNVEIGSFVRIYGKIEIGDNVKISPGAIIKHNIPKKSNVIVSSNYQVITSNSEFNVFFSGYYYNDSKLILIFSGNNLRKFSSINIFLNGEKINDIRIRKEIIVCNNISEYSGELLILLNNHFELRVWLKQNLRGDINDNKRVLQR